MPTTHILIYNTHTIQARPRALHYRLVVTTNHCKNKDKEFFSMNLSADAIVTNTDFPEGISTHVI